MKILITGGGGFLSAWIIKRLLPQGHTIRVFDLNEDRAFLREMVGDEADNIEWVRGDIGDTGQVVAAAGGCESIIHLAGVLTPFCMEDPIAGARVNVIGTLNVFEAAKALGIDRVIYTSSGGVFGLEDDVVPVPITHYGAFKLANEGSARAYWHEHGISSIGFRPFVVYGPGRERGLTAGITAACKAAALGLPYEILLTGPVAFVYVDDVAAAFVAAVQRDYSGAHTLNLPGTLSTVEDVVAHLQEIVPGARLSCAGDILPSISSVRNEYDSTLLNLPPETSLRDGLKRTVEHYRAGATR